LRFVSPLGWTPLTDTMDRREKVVSVCPFVCSSLWCSLTLCVNDDDDNDDLPFWATVYVPSLRCRILVIDRRAATQYEWLIGRINCTSCCNNAKGDLCRCRVTNATPAHRLAQLHSTAGRSSLWHYYNLKSHKYVCITTYKPDTKSNANPTTKQHAIVNIQLNVVTCPTYPDEFIRDILLHRPCDFRL